MKPNPNESEKIINTLYELQHRFNNSALLVMLYHFLFNLVRVSQ